MGLGILSLDAHVQDLEIGLNATFKKLIQGDVVLCITCGATQMGPPNTCECESGRSKPTAADEDACKIALVAAARGRLRASKAAEQVQCPVGSIQ